MAYDYNSSVQDNLIWGTDLVDVNNLKKRSSLIHSTNGQIVNNVVSKIPHQTRPTDVVMGNFFKQKRW